jgi:DnaK suppressor protein
VSLTQPQSALLERSLDRIEEEVREKIHETLPLDAEEKNADHAGDVQDFGDEAAASTEQDLNYTLHERYLRELRDIEAVRKRLADGVADRCDDCGEPIDWQRLLAYPFATRCLECQARHEKLTASS